MKTLRVWLLIVLAVLLPVRGAVAAAMSCEMSGVSASAATDQDAVDTPGRVDNPMLGHDMGDGMHAGMSHAIAQDIAHDIDHDLKDAEQTVDPPLHADHHAGSASKCGVCCDLCSLTPMPSDLSALPLRQMVSSVGFAGLSAAAPSFISAGQERPPRSM